MRWAKSGRLYRNKYLILGFTHLTRFWRKKEEVWVPGIFNSYRIVFVCEVVRMSVGTHEGQRHGIPLSLS